MLNLRIAGSPIRELNNLGTLYSEEDCPVGFPSEEVGLNGIVTSQMAYNPCLLDSNDLNDISRTY